MMANKDEPKGLYIGEFTSGNVFDSDVKHFLEMLWRNGYATRETDEINTFEIYELDEKVKA